MDLNERISVFVELGDRLRNLMDDQPHVVRDAIARNPWFTEENISHAAGAISENYLNASSLEQWLSRYKLDSGGQMIGLVLAGNIPFVGFHDLLCVLISGHKAMVKMSDRDAALMGWLIEEIKSISTLLGDRIIVVERLKDFDAVIATGSDSTAGYFEKYFSIYPHIIRRNRHAVAILDRHTSKDDLYDLAKDVFMYFGLGCRNVSHLFIESGVKPEFIIEGFEAFSDVINHNKYKNNYDYNHALYLLNREPFLTNDFLIMLPRDEISSRIACLHYSFYDNKAALEAHLENVAEEIQCTVGPEHWRSSGVKAYGTAQKPTLDDYADGVDTIEFLNGLK